MNKEPSFLYGKDSPDLAPRDSVVRQGDSNKIIFKRDGAIILLVGWSKSTMKWSILIREKVGFSQKTF